MKEMKVYIEVIKKPLSGLRKEVFVLRCSLTHELDLWMLPNPQRLLHQLAREVV